MEEQKIQNTNLTIQEKYNKGLEFKKEGNEQFKTKEWKKALTCYHKALMYVTGFQSPDSEYYKYANEDQKANTELSDQLKQLQHDLYSNMGQIYIYQEKFQKAVDALDKAIKCKQDGDTAKVIYRKAIAKIGLWDIEGSRFLLAEVVKKDLSQKNEVEKLLIKLEQMQKQTDKEVSKSYKKMFA